MEWVIIKEFPNYKISNSGIVKNFKTNNIIKQVLCGQYYKVTLNDSPNKKLKNYKIHRLVGEYFITNPDNFNIIDHIDGDKLNNNVTNLRWCSPSTNVNNWYSKRTKYNKIEQYNLQNELLKTWNSVSSIEKELNIKGGSIRGCCNGNMPTYKGFIWKYTQQDRKQQSKTTIDLSNYVCIGKINGNDFSKYSISKDGSIIINTKKQKEITFFTTHHKYKSVYLYTNTKTKFQLLVHKIINKVLKNGNYDDIIDHIDSNRVNNTIENLESVTRKENTIRAVGKSVKQIDIKTNELIKIFRSLQDAFSELNKTYGANIRLVCNGERKSAFGYKWEWV